MFLYLTFDLLSFRFVGDPNAERISIGRDGTEMERRVREAWRSSVDTQVEAGRQSMSRLASENVH